MYNDYFEQKANPKETLAKKREKQKQATMLIALMLIGGLAYYFLGYLPEEKIRVKEEIEEMLKDNWQVSMDKLDKGLWEDSEGWEEYLEGLFLPSQVQGFKERMIETIERKVEELEEEERGRPRKMREEVISEVKNVACQKGELEMPKIKEIVEKFTENVNNAPVKDIGEIKKKATELIEYERFKRQRLHWKRQPHSWADRWLMNKQADFITTWTEFTKKLGQEPPYFNMSASYKIYFSPSLWNELTEEQKANTKAEELKLRDEVSSYKFSSIVENWENKVKPNPIRGELDAQSNELDNNAIFYGAPRTGKSVMAEKLACEADVYPLVVIQGSALTPRKADYDAQIDPLTKFIFTLCDVDHTLVDDFGFEREENGEVRYILFIDEANQICNNTVVQDSTKLTFLKECMGGDNRDNETQNLWIAATNHLDQIDIAVYQSGRLSNQLCFSWTLSEFLNYADDAGISSQFPQHWTEAKTLNDEDNKWVNRFNKIIFDKDFLPFWNTFIAHNPNCEYEPEKDNDSQTNQQPNTSPPKKTKIKWGEFFEFFWRLYDSKQLESFEGKFINPRTAKMEEVVEKASITIANKISVDISKTLDTRLNELSQSTINAANSIQTSQNNMTSTISQIMGEIRDRIQNLGGSRSSSYH